MDKKELRETLAERKAINNDDKNGYLAMKKCWDTEINLLCENINDTVDFFENECTGEEFAWLSEVFDGISEKTQSSDFINCLEKLMKKYPDETEQFQINEAVDFAKTYIMATPQK